MTNNEEQADGEDWHIDKGASVLIATDNRGEAAGVRLGLHMAGACAVPATRADLLLHAFVRRVHADPAWVTDLLAWRLDNSAP